MFHLNIFVYIKTKELFQVAELSGTQYICDLFNVLHRRNSPVLLLPTLVRIYKHNEIKIIRPDNNMTQYKR
jgi:hypothetical protein